jgi:hypothetical protein
MAKHALPVFGYGFLTATPFCLSDLAAWSTAAAARPQAAHAIIFESLQQIVLLVGDVWGINA